jgi:hypothetical protein
MISRFLSQTRDVFINVVSADRRAGLEKTMKLVLTSLWHMRQKFLEVVE